MLLDAIRDDFSVLEEWEDRYRYVIELGKQLEPLCDEAHTEANKVKGCASQVWLTSTITGGELNTGQVTPDERRLHFKGDSDAFIVRGLIAILLAIVNDKTPREILALSPQDTFDELGLRAHLTPQRSNGLASMIQRIKRDAEHAAGLASG